jgi:hypothetical protein
VRRERVRDAGVGGERADGFGSRPAHPSRYARAMARPETTLPPELTVREARDRYLADNGFDTSGYSAPTFGVTVFGRTWVFRNVASRRRAIPLHDLHHVATGYGTSLVGEGEVSAFELRAGIDSPILWLLKLSAIGYGLFTSPRRVLASFARARGAATLYLKPHDYDALLDRSLGELRAHLGIPADGLADRPATLHGRAPRTPDAPSAISPTR